MTDSALLDGLLPGGWVTDGGLETDLIFNHGVDLPEFASFPLLDDHDGRRLLERYYAGYAAIAAAVGAGLMVESPTWRANPDWAARVGYDREALDLINTAAIDYHAAQVGAFAAAGADLVHAMTMTEPAEAIGIVRAARAAGIPVAVSFTVETNGRLPDGSTLADAVTAMEIGDPADFYGVNCAHPTHVINGLDGGDWQQRLRFFRPNASQMSHEELDAAEELDPGDLGLLFDSTTQVRDRVASLGVMGGCCGTDARHVAALWGAGSAMA